MIKKKKEKKRCKFQFCAYIFRQSDTKKCIFISSYPLRTRYNLLRPHFRNAWYIHSYKMGSGLNPFFPRDHHHRHTPSTLFTLGLSVEQRINKNISFSALTWDTDYEWARMCIGGGGGLFSPKGGGWGQTRKKFRLIIRTTAKYIR